MENEKKMGRKWGRPSFSFPLRRRADFHFFGLNYLSSFVSFLFPEIMQF